MSLPPQAFGDTNIVLFREAEDYDLDADLDFVA
jgi:hypothetical protein